MNTSSDRERWLMPLFALTVFSSGFLLFQVQPLISRFILPWFGGSPAVWTAAMLFFQAVLFGGYLSAHLTTSRVTVGLPYFALSATGPLLQRWFLQIVPGRSPYRLFALSNLGSLLALLSYPLCVEPSWGGRTQAAAWIGLPALATVLFLAVTNEVCQNVATVPLLWIVPLSLYLVPFIVAFDHPRWYRRRSTAAAALVLIVLMAGYQPITEWLGDVGGSAEADFSSAWWVESGVHFLGLAVVLVLCHGEVARLKPNGAQLTAFYLSMSAGGAVGGLLVNLVCPSVFTTFREFPLALVAAAGVAAAVLATGGAALPAAAGLRWTGAAVLGLAAIAGTWHWQIAPRPLRPDRRVVHESRNFYGTLAVQERGIGAPDASFVFFSGHIQHGREFAAADRRQVPLTYYGAGSGVQLAMEHVQQTAETCHLGVVGQGVATLATYARPGDRMRFYEINPRVVDVAQNTAWFHYLSDCRGTVDVVVGDARLQLERELAAAGPLGFDLLVLDAFSGDAIPAHLLTTEAFSLYDRHLRPGGVLAVHVTNTFLDIQPVVRRLADAQGFLHRRVYRAAADGLLLYRNDWMLLSRDLGAVEAADDDVEALPDRYRRPREVPLWTDDYGSLLPLLL
ncbi:MAG: fused MFS/spermidine synthase [Pirellulales bacterium]